MRTQKYLDPNYSAVSDDVKYPIPSYKWKRIFYSTYFRKLWTNTNEPKLSWLSHVYSMCVHMCRQRLNEKEIYTVMVLWFRKHSFHCHYDRLRFIVKETKDFSRKYVRSQKKAEKQRAKARKAANAGIAK